MRNGRWLAAAFLALMCVGLPAYRAMSQDTKTTKETQPPKKGTKGDDDDPKKSTTADDKELQKIKDDLAATKKDLASALKELKKSADAADAAAKAAGAAKADAAAAKKATDELTKEIATGKPDPKKAEDEARKAEAAAKKAEEDVKATAKAIADADAKGAYGTSSGDSAWMLASSALVLFMVPGLALFYCGMVRRKNVLATMMQSMAALAVVGVYWIAVGYALAFGPSAFQIDMGLLGGTSGEKGGVFGWSWDLIFLKGIEPTDTLPQYNIPVYLHVMFQGMFAIITPALISGAIAERIRFWPFCIFMLLWVTFVYCPLAHMVWAFDWFDPNVLIANRGKAAIGLLGKLGALDFAGGTVVHIAAGMAGLACCLVLRKRHGYPQQVAHPNSMVLTLLGAGLLWFGWFGFNGGSALNGTALAVSAFAATQAAAAAAGLGWVLVEWLHKGKPTALGLASGIVAGLVAVTPASGFVYMWGGVLIGLAAAVICYLAVNLKGMLGYDDSLDAFGVHGVGGFVGAVLTGVFCSTYVNSVGADGPFAYKAHRARYEQLKKVDDKDSKPIADAKADIEKAKEGVTAKEKELKYDELTGKVEADEKKLADLPADAKPEAKKVAEDAVKDAKEAVAKADKELEEPKAILADKETIGKKLDKELSDLKAIVDKQDDVDHEGKDKKNANSQVMIQLKAAGFSVVFAFVLSLVLCVGVQAITLGNFTTSEAEEAQGLDRTEHGEVGFDFSAATETVTVTGSTPRAATAPPMMNGGRFDLQVSGVTAVELMKAWSALCMPSEKPANPDFLAVYPYLTTITGTKFRFRGGDPGSLAKRVTALFSKQIGKPVTVSKA